MLDDHHKVMHSPLHLSYCAGTLVTVSLRLGGIGGTLAASLVTAVWCEVVCLSFLVLGMNMVLKHCQFPG